MKLQLNYKGKDYSRIEELVVKAYADISLFFKGELENLIVCVHKRRKEFDKKLNRQTKLWEVANAMNGQIDIIHIDSFLKESSHNRDEFLPILKHEIAHLFIEKMTKDKAVPKWLNEGLVSYASEQYKNIKFTNYIEEDFCEKLGTPKGWDEHSDYSAYNTASLFVNFLVEKYTLSKINELLLKLNNNYYYPDFEIIFKNIFGRDLKGLEREFLDNINMV